LREELDKTGLGYIWQESQKNNVSRTCKIIKEIFDCEMKLEWGEKEYTGCCTLSDGSGLAWFKTGIWKLRRMGRGFEKGRCPYVDTRKM
jgi:hypothetical protein